jgi:hypothetical protein
MKYEIFFVRLLATVYIESYYMKLNLFFLSAAAAIMVNAVSGTSNPAQVELGDAGYYAILAKTGISSIVPQLSAITGDIAVSPKTAAAITGFSLVPQSAGSDFWTSTQLINGNAYAVDVDHTGPTPIALKCAVRDMEIAYLDAAGRTADTTNLGDGDLRGQTLTEGVYTFTTDVGITAEELTFAGSDTDVFVIQIEGNFNQSAGTKMILTGGALAKNIFWQVEGKVTVDAGSHMEGILLVKTDVTFITGSSLNGRIFAKSAVALQMATITEPPL